MPPRAPPALHRSAGGAAVAGDGPNMGFPRRQLPQQPWSGLGLSTPEIENFVVDTISAIMISRILEAIDLQVLGSYFVSPWNLRQESEPYLAIFDHEFTQQHPTPPREVTTIRFSPPFLFLLL